MPTISTYSPNQRTSISGGVQSANIDTSGAGAVAKAISGVAQQGANTLNQILMRQKVEQADTYAREWTTKKNIERQQKHRELQSQLEANPTMDYLGEMAKWEDDRTKEILTDAPTDLAKTAFNNSDSPYKSRNLIGSEVYIFDFHKTRSKTTQQEANDAKAKRIQGLDADLLESSGSDLISETEFELSETNKASFGMIELGYMDPNEAKLFGKNEANKVAIAGLRSTFTNDRLQQSAKMLDFESMLIKDEAVQAEVRAIMEDATGRKIGETLADGTVIMGTTEEGDVVSYDIEKGTVIDTPAITVFADTKKRVLDKIEDNQILKHLTQEQQQWGINTLLSKLKQKNTESRIAFNNRSQGLWAMLSDKGPNALRYNKSEPDMVGTSQVNEMINQAKGVFAGKPDEYSDWASKTATAVQIGRFKDSSVWDDDKVSRQRITNTQANVLNILDDLGLGEMKDDPLFVAKFTSQAKSELEAYNNKRLMESVKPEYVYSNDSYANKVLGQYLSQENSNPAMAANTLGKLKSVVGSRQDMLGIPKGYQSVYPESYLVDTANRLNSLAKPETGYVGKEALAGEFNKHKLSKGDDYYSFMKSMKGLDPELLGASFFPSTPAGKHAESLALDGIITYDKIRENFKGYSASTGVKEEMIDQLTYRKLAPYISYLRNTTNTGEVEAQLGAWTKSLKANTMSKVMKGVPLNSAVDKSFKDLFTANFHEYNYGADNNVFFKSQLEKSGLSTDMAEASIRYLSEYRNVKNLVPTDTLYKYVPDFVALGKTRAEKNLAVKEAFESGTAQIRPFPDGDSILFRVRDRNNLWSDPLMDNEGNPISIPLKDLKGIKGIVDEANTTSFFGIRF